jgi:hypothetical protein
MYKNYFNQRASIPDDRIPSQISSPWKLCNFNLIIKISPLYLANKPTSLKQHALDSKLYAKKYGVYNVCVKIHLRHTELKCSHLRCGEMQVLRNVYMDGLFTTDKFLALWCAVFISARRLSFYPALGYTLGDHFALLWVCVARTREATR